MSNSGENIEYADPPMMKNLSNEEVDAWVSLENPRKYPLLELPCHTQAVERHIKLVSEASAKAVSAEAKDGIVKTTIRSRIQIPSYCSKKDYKLK